MRKYLLSLILFAVSPMASAAIQSAVVISEPSGYGQRYSRIILQYDEIFNSEYLPATSAFNVKDFQIEQISLGKCIDNRKICRSHELVLHISHQNPNDRFLKVTMQPRTKAPSIERQPQFQIEQRESILVEQDGNMQESTPSQIETQTVKHQIAEQFEQHEFIDKSGIKIRYNLYVPENYDPKKRYPLVMFIHDAGATNDNVRNTLWQGNGATAWADPAWQKKHPAFVLAPQFDFAIVNDNSDDPVALDPTINLIKSLMEEYSIDDKRLYTTGQSGGAMMSIAMNIKYPDFFAASYLVAGQWAVNKVAPMARTKQFVLVSEDDPKAFPTQNEIMEELALNGAVVQKAILSNGNAEIAQINQEVSQLLERNGNIYYMAIKSGTLPDQIREPNSKNLGQAHIGTWKIAYDIDAIKEWLVNQTK